MMADWLTAPRPPANVRLSVAWLPRVRLPVLRKLV